MHPFPTLHAPSQFPDYHLLQARNPIFQMGFGLESRKYQAPVLCSAAPWWPYPVLRNRSPLISRLGLSVIEGQHSYVHRALGRSGQSLVNVKRCRESHGWHPALHSMKTSCAQLWLTQLHSQAWLSMILEWENCKSTHFVRIQKHVLINISFAHTGQPSSLLASCS